MTQALTPGQLEKPLVKLRVKLRENLTNCFDEGELRTLCFDLGLDYADLPGATRTDKAREMVAYFERRQHIPVLIEKCRELRPDVDWGLGWDPPIIRLPWLSVIIVAAMVTLVVIGIIFVPRFFRFPAATLTETLKPPPTPTPSVIVSATVALRTWSGRYVSDTDITSTWKLKAQDTPIGDRQKFTLLCLANDKAALQIFDRFVSALNDEDDRNWELRAVATERLAWEEFTLLNPDTQKELPCNQALEQLKRGEVSLAFRTFHNRFVTAMGQDADWVLRAETTALDKYEKFTAINLASTPTSTPTPTPCAGCSVCPTQRDYHCLQKGAIAKVTPGMDDEYCAETVTLPQPTLAYTVYISMTKRKMEDLGYSLYEVEAYGPTDTQKNLLALYLFSIEADSTSPAAGSVSPYLREQFRRQSKVLAPEAKLRLDSYGKQWAIVDADRIYAIRSENGKLNVYGGAQAAAVSKEDDRYIAPYAIDGNLLTRWASAKCCNSGICPKDDKGNLKCDNPDGQDPQWLKITLPKPATIDRIVLKWERAYAVEYCAIINP